MFHGLVSRSRIIGAFVVAVAIIGSALTYTWFIDPSVDEPQAADAVVMLGGGRGERLALALDLIDRDMAPVLAIMNGLQWSKGIELCLSDDQPFEIVCPGDVPNTRGEAREIAILAEERGWDSIILVTSDFHIHRATTHVSRCFDGTIYRIAAGNDFSPSRWIFAIGREWAGTIRNVFVRGC